MLLSRTLAFALAATACVVLPWVAQRSLDHKVDNELAPAASASLGIPIELGSASVGLTGTLSISHLQVGDVFTAKRVIANISDRILVEGLQASIVVAEDGSTNLDALLAARQDTAQRATPPELKKGRIQEVQLLGGSMHVEWLGHGTIDVRRLDATLHGPQLHVVLGNTELSLEHQGWQFEGVVPQAAVDYQRHGLGVQRALAYGGTMHVRGPKGAALVRELLIAHKIGGEEFILRARAGIDKPTGSVAVQASPTLGGFDLELQAENAPLALLGAFLPEGLDPAETLVSGDLQLQQQAQQTNLDLSLAIANLDIAQQELSSRPLQLDLHLDGKGILRRRADTSYVDVELRSLRTQEINLSGAVSGEWRGGVLPELATIDLDLDEVGCDAALSALPTGLRPMLAGLELRGRMKSSLRLMLSKRKREDTHLQVHSGVSGCQVVREPPSADTLALLGGYEHRSPDGALHVLHEGAAGFTAIDEMPTYLSKAFVAAEDARFFRHEGFDRHQIERSLAIDMEQGRLVRGGSTISQQLVKNLFLHRKRTLARKLQEAALTWRLEENLQKDRILEIYLNIIEFGDQDTYGITAAAHRWFAVAPQELSVLQAAFLAAIVPEPTSMSARIRDAEGLDPVSAGRVATILRAMKRGRIISTSEYRRARGQTLRFASDALAVQVAP